MMVVLRNLTNIMGHRIVWSKFFHSIFGLNQVARPNLSWFSLFFQGDMGVDV